MNGSKKDAMSRSATAAADSYDCSYFDDCVQRDDFLDEDLEVAIP